MMSEDEPILAVEDLETHFPVTEGFLRRERGRVRAVDGISFGLGRGEILGIVGESGSGKSTVARTLMRLETPTGGHIEFDGTRLTDMDSTEMQAFRRRVQMVFQDTASSFDPRMTIGDAIREPMIAHGLTARRVLEDRVRGLLESVGLSGEFADRYPHQLSGGEKQRAALARALSLDPDVLVLDEPVSALDVSVQARIITLISRLQSEFDLSIVLITHDMSVVRELCTRVAVMYLGEIVELAPTDQLFEDPSHPYTAALLEVIPEPDPTIGSPEMELQGSIPDPIDPPSGCRFHTRCPAVIQPSHLDLQQEVYRSVLDLYVALRDGTFGVDSVLDGAVAGDPSRDGEQTVGTRGMTEHDSFQAVVRDRYGIPAELSDHEAETTVRNALDRLQHGEIQTAEELLQGAFGTVCERKSPPTTSTPHRRVACHLHSASVDTNTARFPGKLTGVTETHD